MPWGKKDAEPEGQVAEPEEPDGLHRTCHICEKEVESRVWYGKNREEGKRKKRHQKRVYACPSCYFELDDDEREEYYRERV